MFSKRILGLAIVAILLVTACGGASGNNQEYGPGDNPSTNSNGGYTAQIISNFPPLQPNGSSIVVSNPRNSRCAKEQDGNFEWNVELDFRLNNIPKLAEYRIYYQAWGKIKLKWLKDGEIMFFGPLITHDSSYWALSIRGGNNFFVDFPFRLAETTELWMDQKPVSRFTITLFCNGTSTVASVTNEP